MMVSLNDNGVKPASGAESRHDQEVTVNLCDIPVVLLAGAGSDDEFIRQVFSEPLEHHGTRVIAVPPEPTRLIDSYICALDDAAQHGPIAVGGISLGAAIATMWALNNSARVLAVLAALPAWTGPPQEAPAAVAARQGAQHMRCEGLESALKAMQATSPVWLAKELTRSWSRQWPALPDAMVEAATYVSPSVTQLQRLNVPMGVAGAHDDPVHPWQVAAQWAAAAPYAQLRTLSLADIGANPATLGQACVAALKSASVMHP